jgi:hypothetical protein
MNLRAALGTALLVAARAGVARQLTATRCPWRNDSASLIAPCA